MARTAGSHSDITGPRVRAAAMRLFAQGGYAAVSMRMIAAEVGVQVGALYNYTPDKQTLLFDLLQTHMSELLNAFVDDATVAPALRLKHFVTFHIAFHAVRRDAVVISSMELRNLEPKNFARIEALRRGYEDRLETILRAGVSDRTFDLRDNRITTLAIIAMLTGVNTWFRDDGRLSLEEVTARYWDLIARSVLSARGG